MGEHLLRGKAVSDEQIQAWADEAEGLTTRSEALRAAVREWAHSA